jgi:hypothetical protein
MTINVGIVPCFDDLGDGLHFPSSARTRVCLVLMVRVRMIGMSVVMAGGGEGIRIITYVGRR